MLKKWCILITVLLTIPLVLGAGSGTQADPFIVTSLTYEGQFVTNGVGHYVSPSININGVNYPSGWLNGKAKVISFSGNLVNGKNTVSIQSNYYHADGCCWSAYCDYVLAAIRVGSATDNNVVYTQASGWSGTNIREYMESGGGCTFYKLEEQCQEVYVCYDWCGWTTECNTVAVPVRVDMPYTTQEKCVNTAVCGDCCQTSLSRDFWVKLCATSETCTTAGDENCNNECDYDSSTCSHGDSACPVGITAISVSSTTPTAGSSITVDCTSTVNANSIFASVDGVGDCTWQYWVSNNVARFSCNVGSTIGSRTVRCSVYTTRSYQSGSDKTTTINVLASSCSAYTSSSSCEADSRCDWCPQCVGVKYTGGSNRCVNTGTCPAAYCWRGQCGATCDSTQGGCTSPSTCDLTTCSCSSVYHCNRCSTVYAYQRVDFYTTDPTCVSPYDNPVTRTCDCSCPSQGLDTSWDLACVSSCSCKPNWQSCTLHTECCSGFCGIRTSDQPRCEPSCSSIGEPCTIYQPCCSGYTCSGGQCGLCTNECSPSGARQCLTSTTYRTCGNYDADSCLEWSSSSSCSSGQTCSNGQCVTSGEVCTTPGDENNNGQCDYDSSVCSHGDSACPVGVTAISVSSSSPVAGSSIIVDCTSSVAGVNSIAASIDGVGSCSWQSWVGSVARFSCSVGSSAGSRTVRCSVDTSKSYAVSGQESRTATINVLPSDCSAYTSSSSCEGDSRCDWCPQCVGVKYTGGSNRCVNTGTCPAAYCWLGQCGATCDSTQGGCSGFFTCDLGTCSCVCTNECSSSGLRECVNTSSYRICGNYDADSCFEWGSSSGCPSGQMCSSGQCVSCPAEVCTDGLDNDCDGLVDCRDSDCSSLAACSCISPVAENCGNGFDDDCDGLIDCVDSDCSSIAACQNCNAQCSRAICKPRSELCNNGLDDDCDGLIDCQDSDCSANFFCCTGADCGCSTGTRLCSDGVCRTSCPVDPPCNNNGVCDLGESCSCADCFNERDTCKPGNVCNSNTKQCRCGVGLLPCVDGSCNITCGECGDGVIDSGEVCDGDVFPLDVNSCEDLGFDGGVLSCGSDCHFDTSQCTDSVGICGDGVRNVGEGCDGLNFGSVEDCISLGFSGGVLDCGSDCFFDTSGCYDVPGCESDGDCPSGAVCGEDGRCGCPGGTDLCADGSCSEDCESTDNGYKTCVLVDGICSPGESCHCSDCQDGDRASCELPSVCISGFCTRCELSGALWDVDNCNGNICVVANNSLVDLFVMGNDGCSGKSFKFRVWEEKTGDVVGYPSSAVFADGFVSSSWNAVWRDVSGWFGLGDDDPIYLFYVRAVGGIFRDSDNKVKVCNDDDDCDGVTNLEDQCPNTPFGDLVKTSGTYKGCSDSQVSCVSQIDCSMVEWSDCDANNLRTRMICKDLGGLPFFDESGSCCNQQSTCRCSLGSCLDRGNWIPTVRECLIEEEFPFFTAVNILLVLSLLLCYYFFMKVRRKTR